MNYHISDNASVKKGKNNIKWAMSRMKVLSAIKERFIQKQPLKGYTIAACLHVTAETANLMITLKQAGARVVLCASNPLSTQDDTAIALVKYYHIPVFAIHGEDTTTYYKHIHAALSFKPNITMDDGADLVNQLHKMNIQKKENKYIITNNTSKTWEFFGSSEETTTGVIRLKAMEKDNALKVPVVAVNDSDTKHFFDNRYGTGQSSIDGILRATNVLIAGKTFVVSGYGFCGKGLADRARGMGANVIVTEVNPVRALEAVMDGYRVMPIRKAAKKGDIFVTVTGDTSVITIDHIYDMKDGAILANSGHFDIEIEMKKLEMIAKRKYVVRENLTCYDIPQKKSGKIKRIYVIGEGRLVNLTAAEGHPSEVMDLSFANQALTAEWLVKKVGTLQPKVYRLPKKIDNNVAQVKLDVMNISIDRLTNEQKKYLNSWKIGT